MWIKNGLITTIILLGEILCMHDVISLSEYERLVEDTAQSSLEITNWVGFNQVVSLASKHPMALIPFIPGMHYHPITKFFVVPFQEEPDVSKFPSVNDYGIVNKGIDNTQYIITKKPCEFVWIKCVFFPDLRDI